MRILLAHNSLYYPSHGGGDKSNRLLMEALAARGHEVRVVARIEWFDPTYHDRFLHDLSARGVAPEVDNGVARFKLGGVDVHTLTLHTQMRAYFAARIESFDPDIIVTSTDDPAQLLFDVAIQAPRARVVHLVRATIAVPFGPDASMPNAERTDRLRRADAIVGVSEYVARYVREHGNMAAVHVPISLMDPGEPPDVGRFDSEFVTIANPCAVKGLAILLALADRMPDVRFAAVPTWGTNAEDMVALRQRANIAVLPPVDNLDDLMRRTRVALVPSLWAEARSRIVVEAMLRGVPVIASNVGGIPEAKLGVPYLFPVNPIRSYRQAVDENMAPVAEVPPQDIGPWEEALTRLTRDRAHWTEIAHESRRAALDYARGLSVEPFERLLLDLAGSPKRPPTPVVNKAAGDRQRLLALLLKQKTAGSKWFPFARQIRDGQTRLFCFPHAGGGVMAYRAWAGLLGDEISVCPALLPGRETRVNEAPIDDMDRLIAALAVEIEPSLDRPYSFFGHSMGAAIAFELVRMLRRSGAPLPAKLVVSAARAPQFRENHRPPPEPSHEEFLAELRRHEDVSRELLDHPEAARVILPALRADSRLYRNYVYLPGDPLALPICAYGGASDPNVRPDHIEPWRAQTSAAFTRREFAGGHFYLQTNRAEFLRALAVDLR